MPVKVIIPPAVEPVSLAEVKLHARVDNDLEDDLIASFIGAARRHGESLTHRSFVPQTLELTLDAFPQGAGGSICPGHRWPRCSGSSTPVLMGWSKPWTRSPTT